MEQAGKTRIARILLGLVLVVVAVVTLRSAQVSETVLDGGLRPGPELRNYQNRIRATQTLLETGRLEVSGS